MVWLLRWPKRVLYKHSMSKDVAWKKDTDFYTIFTMISKYSTQVKQLAGIPTIKL